MELELDPKLKILPFKVRASSKESQPHKAAHVLDTDLRNHWSTSTNTKEWLLLELEEPCLLHQIRIHNKSVLEWEISVGLRYKPDAFLKVRPRCEAPRREFQYGTNYAPCRYVRISCLRGNPIAIFYVQLIGITMPGLEPEFQPLVDYLLPQITSYKQDTQDLYLQLLRDITTRLSPFLPHLEGDLAANAEGMESNLKFLAMLSGPFYPILMVVDERDRVKSALSSGIDQELSKTNQASVFTVSSNFQAPPRRSRSPVPSQQSVGHLLAFRPEAVLLLLKVGFKDSTLGIVCRMVCRLLRRLTAPVSSVELNAAASEVPSGSVGQIVSGSDDTATHYETANSSLQQTDYSSLFGEDFQVFDDDGGDMGALSTLDIATVEEGLLHLLYACVSQPVLCRRLVEMKPDLIPSLPFIQAIVPALRPKSSVNADQLDESFAPWQAPLVQRAFSQVVSLSTSPTFRPLLDACAGYLSSFSLAHEKAACIIIDLCSGPLAPWLPVVIAKVDLAFELVEDLLGIIQVVHQGTDHARAALIYVMLGLSGHMDDVLTVYKDAKHKLIFLIEMLEPFLIPAITPVKNTIAFGDVSAVLTEKQEHTCALALDLLRTAVERPGVLSALESEWRQGRVLPSVLLSIMAPHLPLPPGIDLRRAVAAKGIENVSMADKQAAVDPKVNHSMPKNTEEEAVMRPDAQPGGDAFEDPIPFLPAELKVIKWQSFANPPSNSQGFGQFGLKGESKTEGESKDSPAVESLLLDTSNANLFFNLQAEYLQLVNYQERDLRASEFIQFAMDLHTQEDINMEGHHAAIDALLLAAECHLNPFFMLHPTDYQQLFDRAQSAKKNACTLQASNQFRKSDRRVTGMDLVAALEEERDKAVIGILLKAAEWESEILGKAYGHSIISELSLSWGGNDRFGRNLDFGEGPRPEDATTIVRKNQNLLSKFLVIQLQRERINMHEVLLQGLLFLLYSATQLSCPPELIVDIILKSAEQLNLSLMSNHKQLKEGHADLASAAVHRIRRQWALLERLVIAASGGGLQEDEGEIAFSRLVHYKDLVPASAWMARIAEFSSSSFPLVRYVGWKGLARFANCQRQTGLLLASDMLQLSSLLSIFADELTSSTILTAEKACDSLHLQAGLRPSETSQGLLKQSGSDQGDQSDCGKVSTVLYPELDLVAPSLRKQFTLFAQAMLETVCLQLRGIPASSVPDILSWFSELCCCPFSKLGLEKPSTPGECAEIKGYAAANVKFVILHLLEVIVGEHMESIVPELPRVLGVILSLCQSCYCDVTLLDSVLMALKPIISCAVASASASEVQVEDDPTATTFESLCFDSLMEQLRTGPDAKNEVKGQGSQGALLLFLSGSVLSDLSTVRRNELMHLLMRWVEFTRYSSTTSYHNYLCAFQKIFEACESLVQKAFDERGLLFEKEVASQHHRDKELKEPAESLYFPHLNSDTRTVSTSNLYSQTAEEMQYEEIILEGIQQASTESETVMMPVDQTISSGESCDILLKRAKLLLFSSISELEDFEKCLQALVFALGTQLETVWKLHSHLAKKLTKIAAGCLMSTSFLSKTHASIFVSMQKNVVMVEMNSAAAKGRQQIPVFHESALETVAQAVMTFQHSHCWQVGACTMDFILSLPTSVKFSEILPSLFLALQFQCTHAPRVSWRQSAMNWLSRILTRIVPDKTYFLSASLIDLLGILLEHQEPEQRAGVLEQLEKMVEPEDRESVAEDRESGVTAGSSPTEHNIIERPQNWLHCTEKRISIEFISSIVAATWDKVTALAACDPSLRLRRQAMELLLRFIPLAQPRQLHKFLSSVDAILPGLAKSSYTMSDAPVSRLSLALLARACLYSSTDDISTIPSCVWSSLEILSRRSILAEAECAVCSALLQLREHGEDAKQSIQEALSRQTETRQPSSQFAGVRETILEVLARLHAVRVMEDGSVLAAEQEARELEEAEIEVELLKQEEALQAKARFETCKTNPSGLPMTDAKQRLEELRAQIRAEEHSTIRAEIIARRERKRLACRDWQLAFEEAALREMELLQELDREKAAESEREIERRRILEKERAKTRELRHALDMEAEKRTQRDLQRELEQRESGVIRSSRREFSGSTSSSRPRERYREREIGRSGQESRPSSSGGINRENSTTPPATPTAGAPISVSSSLPSIVIASSSISSEAYPGQSLALSQSHDRMDDRGYDESLDGVGLSGEGSTYGDMEAGMIDPGSGSQRQGPRTARPRQIIERRERESRREGKWERKQT